MTDNTFLPAGAPAEAADGNRRNVVLAAVLGAAVLGGGGYYFLAGSSSSDEVVTAAPVVRHQPVTKVPAKTVKPAAKTAAKPAVLPAASTTRIGRNPFQVLVMPPSQNAGATTTQTPTLTTTGTTTTPTGATASSPYSVQLVSITGGSGGTAREYTFRYLGQTKTVIVAQKFGREGHLVVLAYVRDSAGKVMGAYVQVGDADPVEVKIGGKFAAM